MTVETQTGPDETARLQALRQYGILDTPAEPKFDRIVRLAARLLDMPISLVSLVDETRQWFKAKIGLDASETPRSMAFCAHAIQGEDVMVVEDAGRDPRFVENPLVTGDPLIRFYDGAPLTTDDGYKLGTLCVIDRVPRQLTLEQTMLLEDLAGLVVDEMELRRAMGLLRQLATTDPMTGLLNRRSFLSQAESEWQRSSRFAQPLSLLILDIDHFKHVNDNFGHDAGDQVISRVAQICDAQKRAHDLAARYGGEEFVLMMPETDLAGAYRFAERLREAVAEDDIAHGEKVIKATVSIGVAEMAQAKSVDDMLKLADQALYEAKKNGRNRVVSSRAR
jgi:diguanylate cyclase (GGDEF)-like protein